MTEDEVSECLTSAKEDDPMALNRLVEHMYPLVTRIVRCNLPNRTGCEDLVQVVIIKALSNLKQFSGQVPFHHWLGRITVNTCINAFRYEKRRPELRQSDLGDGELEVFELLGSSVLNEDIIRHEATRELVHTLLETLKPEDRMIMSLAFLEGYSLVEVGQMTNLSEGAVKMRIARAKEKMRIAYGQLANHKEQK